MGSRIRKRSSRIQATAAAAVTPALTLTMPRV